MSYQGYDQGQGQAGGPPGAPAPQQQEGMQGQPGLDGSQPPFQGGAPPSEGNSSGAQGPGDMKTTLWYVTHLKDFLHQRPTLTHQTLRLTYR